MATEKALTNIWFEDQKHAPVSREGPENAVIKLGLDWLAAYFSGKEPETAGLPIILQGSSFRQRIWNLLRDIPYGETATYGSIAKKAASSPRAVGSAIARNPVMLILPCHRIIGTNNNLTGYAGGLERKAWLLRHEGNEFTDRPQRTRGDRQP